MILIYDKGNMSFSQVNGLETISFSFYPEEWGPSGTTNSSRILIIPQAKRKGNWKKVVEKEEDCPICHEKLCDIQTECNHLFCEDCITSWFQKTSTCPMCREKIN